MPKYLLCPKVFNEGGQIEQELRIFAEGKTPLVYNKKYTCYFHYKENVAFKTTNSHLLIEKLILKTLLLLTNWKIGFQVGATILLAHN